MAYRRPNQPQFITPQSDRRSSEDTAREAASNDSGMDTEPATPTPRPMSRPPPYEQQDLAALIRQMQEQNAQQQRQMALHHEQTERRQQQQIDQLRLELQRSASNTGVAQLANYLQSHSIQDPLDEEDHRITRLAQYHWRDNIPRLEGRDNYSAWRRAIMLDANYIEAGGILIHEVTPPEDPMQCLI